MYSLKFHAESLFHLKRLLPSKHLRTLVPRLTQLNNFTTGDMRPLVDIIELLEESPLSAEYPELHLHFGHLISRLGAFPNGTLSHKFEIIEGLLSHQKYEFKMARDTEETYTHCEWYWLADQRHDPTLQECETLASMCFALAKPYLTGHFDQVSFYFPHAEPEHGAIYANYLVGQLVFNAPFFAIRFPTNAIDHIQCSHEIYSQNHAEMVSDYVLHKASNKLLQNLSTPPTLTELATSLNLSERTFKRRLQDCGTHYQKLLADIRLQQACLWLQQGESNVSETADRLGYASVANFSKAFKKWSGLSPTKIKSHLNLDDLPLPDGLRSASHYKSETQGSVQDIHNSNKEPID